MNSPNNPTPTPTRSDGVQVWLTAVLAVVGLIVGLLIGTGIAWLILSRKNKSKKKGTKGAKGGKGAKATDPATMF